MKTDLNSLKAELGRLTDVNYLKKEINRIAGEVKNFDVQAHLSPQAKQKVAKLEKRFEELIVKLQKLQKQVDENLDYVLKLVRSKKTTTARRGQSSKSAKKTTAKTTVKKTTRKVAKKAPTKRA